MATNNDPSNDVSDAVKDEIQVPPSPNRIGNPAGSALLDNHEEMKNTMRHDRQRIDESQQEREKDMQEIKDPQRKIEGMQKESRNQIDEVQEQLKDLQRRIEDMEKSRRQIDELQQGLKDLQLSIEDKVKESRETRETMKHRLGYNNGGFLMGLDIHDEESVLKACEKERIWKSKNGETSGEGTGVSQGGDFVGDITVIAYCQQNNWRYVPEYKNGFLKAYGIPFDEAFKMSSLLSGDVVRMLDIRASIRELDEWNYHALKAKKANMEALIEDVITEVFKKSPEEMNSFPAGCGISMEKVNTVDKLFSTKG